MHRSFTLHTRFLETGLAIRCSAHAERADEAASVDAAEALARVAALPDRMREHVVQRLQLRLAYDNALAAPVTSQPFNFKALKLQERLFLWEYTVDCNVRRAAEASGLTLRKATRLLSVPQFAEAVAAKLEERARMSDLNAQYVRDYIKGILELRTMDLFTPGEGGGWLISKENYDKLTDDQKRYIEEPTLVFKQGKAFLTIKFMSKSMALALAARYTLPAKVELTVKDGTEQFFKDLAGLEAEAEDHVEKRLAMYEPNKERTNGQPATNGAA